MNTFKWYRMFFALICMNLALVLTIGSVKASPTRQGETDFAAIDDFVTTQLNELGIPGSRRTESESPGLPQPAGD